MHKQWQNFIQNFTIGAISEPYIHCIMDLSYLGLLKVTGPRAKELLQGQLTCHLDEISSSHASLGAHCNPQGRMISLFRIWYFLDSYYLQMPVDLIPIAINALKKYAVFFKVELSDASHDFLRIGYCGNELNQIVNPVPEKVDELVQADEFTIIQLPNNRYEILGQFSAIAHLWEKLAATNTIVSDSIWKALDFQLRIPNLYPETSEKFLPHEIHLPELNGVSFSKGCYTGQEIIARMQYKGKLKTRCILTSVESNLIPNYGDEIFNDSGIAGSIVDFCKTSYNIYKILIITNKDHPVLFLDSNKTCPLIIINEE